LAICVAVAWGSNILISSPTPASCAILDTEWNLWDVTTNYFNVTDDRFGPVQLNLCLDMERTCAHTTKEPCSVCQYIQNGETPPRIVDQYCIGYSRNETYTPLDQNKFLGMKGFTAFLSGDSDWCDEGKPRNTYINVFCNQPANAVHFVGEAPKCTYTFNLSLTQDCAVSAASFTPTFTVVSITPNSFTIIIDDGYLYEFWNYNVKVNGKYAYQGAHREIFVENLDPGTTYNVVVERDSGTFALLDVIAPSAAVSVTTLPSNLGTIHTTIISGTGTGVLVGLVIAFAIIVVVVGFLKFRQSEWWADKFNGGKRSGKGTFSLLDAEKSTAFDS